MATTMLCPSWSVLRLQSNIITNEQTTQLAKRPICPRPPERLGALVSAFLSAAPLLTRSNIHRRDSLPAVSCNAGFCNAPEARCPTSTMLMALQKPHRSRKEFETFTSSAKRAFSTRRQGAGRGQTEIGTSVPLRGVVRILLGQGRRGLDGMSRSRCRPRGTSAARSRGAI